MTTDVTGERSEAAADEPLPPPPVHAASGRPADEASAEPSDGAEAAAESSWSLSSFLGVVTKVGPPLTIVTALMIYFGWARADAQSRAMGIDVSMFGYSTQDYVLRSISTLYLPLLVLAGLCLGWLALHRRLAELATDPSARPAVRRAGAWAVAVGVVVAVLALLAAWQLPERWLVVTPLVLAGATAVAAYGGYLMNAARDGKDTQARTPAAERAMRAVLVGGVITLALFWELSAYAGVVGRGYAQRLAQTVGSLPRVTVTSPEPLGIEAPGVTEDLVSLPAPGGKDAVRYRTTGLRLLVASGGRVFLLSDGWRPGRGAVVVLPDDDTLHWQLSR